MRDRSSDGERLYFRAIRESLDAAEAEVRLGEDHRNIALASLREVIDAAIGAMVDVSIKIERDRCCGVIADALNRNTGDDNG